MIAGGYGNGITIIFCLILGLFIDNCLRNGGGLGLVYGGLGLLIYLAVVGSSDVMGGIAACSFRLTKMVGMQFKDN
jgi:hypothetical protein